MSDKTTEQAVMDAITAHSGAFRLDLQEWFSHPQHWAIWSAFAWEASSMWRKQRQLIADGLRKEPPHYSPRTIGEYLRHHSAVREREGFKVNDHLWPDLGRLYMLLHPGRAGFFETRGRRAA